MLPSSSEIKNYLLTLQNRICHMLQQVDAKHTFVEENWQHSEGGGGKTRLLVNGHHIEKAGVNFSHVHGSCLPEAATARHPELNNTGFEAMGVSVVVHPRNPYAPTSHLNVRFISLEKGKWWVGGGFDLTPYYGFLEDGHYWHTMAQQACDPFGAEVYSRYKKWCDAYFYLPHRQESRGIGGLFFDDLSEWGLEACFQFLQSVGEHYLTAYQTILKQRITHPFGERERYFQSIRRGRYVEFNLLYDRGTLFGLQSGGRTESILMSLPPLVAWQPFLNVEQDQADLMEFFAYFKKR